MRAFRYRGERILEWRRAIADTALGEFLRAAASAREARRLADEAERRSAQAEIDAVAAMRGAANVSSLERHRIWIARERRHADGCRVAHQEQQRIADVFQTALQLARRHVKVMERLRDRAERRYHDLERQMDMKALDELATIQYARRRVDEGAGRDY